MAHCECQDKTEWPELVGEKGKAAAAVVECENPKVKAIVLKDGTPTTKDYRVDRVWVWVNACDVVIRAPRVGKDAWPELVGLKGEQAVGVVESENPNVNAIVVMEGTSVTGDFRCDRVRVWVNCDGVVIVTPLVG